MGPEALDFWLGTWTATWEGGGGTNTITRELGDAVVVERFEAGPPIPWSGMSVSVHEPLTGLWRQTWVDSNGSYWHFVAEGTDEGTIFATPGPVDEDQTFKRMVFSDVERDAFHWRWESSVDGTAWVERWAIDYRRAEG
ncbi:MAG: hypothetical protein ABI595_11630 [Actinomycetota bacterium]